MTALASPSGHLADNVLHFARVLRHAGMPVGTDRVMTALHALQVAGLASRADFHAVLCACLVDRAEHLALFDEAFRLFWSGPAVAGGGDALPLLSSTAPSQPPEPLNRRLASALGLPAPQPHEALAEQAPAHDASMSWAEREVLRQADFQTMTTEEWRAAQRMLAQLAPVFERLPTRRLRSAPHPGRVDWRATMAAMARHGGELRDLRWRARRTAPAPLVLLADISGSMSRYSRMLLHFAHALGHADARVESFVFGTRLTRTTRLLRHRDPDLAVAQVMHAVQDWSGGTRIAETLREFNLRWARRTLSGQATVLLVTDGLERGDTASLAFEMERLHKSCRRLLWLNPLLRYDRFEPRASGMKAMLPHVDRFLPVHNLASLEQLVTALASG